MELITARVLPRFRLTDEVVSYFRYDPTEALPGRYVTGC